MTSALIQKLPQEIEEAFLRTKEYVSYTPLLKSHFLSELTQTHFLLKCENFQYTGSFKIRGASNKIIKLLDQNQYDHIITASSGNHGLAVAMMAEKLNLKAQIFVPESVSPYKLEKLRALIAIVTLHEGDALQAENAAILESHRTQTPYIPPYNDVDIIAGQGTIGLEISRQTDHLDAVFIAVGGGGLLSGTAAYLKSHFPKITVFACWPERERAMYECLKKGKICDVEEKKTLSDGTAGGIEENSITFELCQKLIDHTVLVSEIEIAQAMKYVALHESMIIEGAAGVAIAGALKVAGRIKGQKIAVAVCGRNITLSTFLDVIN